MKAAHVLSGEPDHDGRAVGKVLEIFQVRVHFIRA
jgi:hypothetical protein